MPKDLERKRAYDRELHEKKKSDPSYLERRRTNARNCYYDKRDEYLARNDTPKHREVVRKWANNERMKLVEVFGLSCHVCGLTSLCREVFHLHAIVGHPINEKGKKFYGTPWWRWARENSDEILYCCQNCHALIHKGISPYDEQFTFDPFLG